MVKTQILHLDSHDDIVSARDKMGWSKAHRILLVWPERGNVLHRRLDLTLIQRRSKALGAQLALVTVDSQVRFYAAELGIPVFKTLGRAQRAVWRTPRRLRTSLPVFPPAAGRIRPDLNALRSAARPASPAWLNWTITRLAIFILGILALLTLIAILLPGAEIEIDPQTRPQSTNLNVQSSPDFSAVDLAGKVPSQAQRVIVSGNESQRTSGFVLVPDKFAGGQVMLTNRSGASVFVPEGTILRTTSEPVVRFATIRPGRVPAGQAASITLPVRALLPGRSGNLPSGALEGLEGALGSKLTVTNIGPTRGGSDLLAPAPSQQDYHGLEANLMKSLQRTALQELAEGLEPDDFLLEDTLVLHQVIERKFDPESSQPADWLNLDLRLEYEGQVVSGKDLQALAAGALDKELPGGFKALPGPLMIAQLTSPRVTKDGAAQWRLKASRELQALASPAKVISLIPGLLPAQAQQRLSSELFLASPARIRIFPTWWPRLPFVPFRIRVVSGQ